MTLTNKNPDAKSGMAERADRFWARLENEVWPKVPAELRQGISKQEREEILGYGPEGV